jgi:hypothetical protein
MLQDHYRDGPLTPDPREFSTEAVGKYVENSRIQQSKARCSANLFLAAQSSVTGPSSGNNAAETMWTVTVLSQKAQTGLSAAIIGVALLKGARRNMAWATEGPRWTLSEDVHRTTEGVHYTLACTRYNQG